MDASLPQPGILFTILMFAAMIGPLVFLHEMGHYLVGRLFKTRVESFSIGFGRRIAGWTDRHGTDWQLSALPLGGYVKFAGDANAAGAGSTGLDDVPEAERHHYFAFKPLWQRALIVAAGPAINFLFAVAVFAAFIGIYGHSYSPPVVESVLPDSAAAGADLRPGDEIRTAGGREIDRFEDLVRVIAINPGTPIDMRIARDGRLRRVTVTPTLVEEIDRFGNRYAIGRLGVTGAPPIAIRRGPVETLYYAAEDTVLLTRSMMDTLGQVISGRRSLKELGGPIKIAQVSGQQATLGLAAFVSLMALVSINLGFINLLPIPMLDGGHLLLYAAEAVRGRPVDERVQEWAFMTGLFLIASFMLVVTFNDLASLGLWRQVAGLIG